MACRDLGLGPQVLALSCLRLVASDHLLKILQAKGIKSLC